MEVIEILTKKTKCRVLWQIDEEWKGVRSISIKEYFMEKCES